MKRSEVAGKARNMDDLHRIGLERGWYLPAKKSKLWCREFVDGIRKKVFWCPHEEDGIVQLNCANCPPVDELIKFLRRAIHGITSSKTLRRKMLSTMALIDDGLRPDRNWLLRVLSKYPGRSCPIFDRNYRYERPSAEVARGDWLVEDEDDWFREAPNLPASKIKRTNQLRTTKADRLANEESYLKYQVEQLTHRLQRLENERHQLPPPRTVRGQMGEKFYADPLHRDLQSPYREKKKSQSSNSGAKRKKEEQFRRDEQNKRLSQLVENSQSEDAVDDRPPDKGLGETPPRADVQRPTTAILIDTVAKSSEHALPREQQDRYGSHNDHSDDGPMSDMTGRGRQPHNLSLAGNLEAIAEDNAEHRQVDEEGRQDLPIGKPLLGVSQAEGVTGVIGAYPSLEESKEAIETPVAPPSSPPKRRGRPPKKTSARKPSRSREHLREEEQVPEPIPVEYDIVIGKGDRRQTISAVSAADEEVEFQSPEMAMGSAARTAKSRHARASSNGKSGTTPVITRLMSKLQLEQRSPVLGILVPDPAVARERMAKELRRAKKDDMLTKRRDSMRVAFPPPKKTAVPSQLLPPVLESGIQGTPPASKSKDKPDGLLSSKREAELETPSAYLTASKSKAKPDVNSANALVKASKEEANKHPAEVLGLAEAQGVLENEIKREMEK